jgi:hypothetical protein
MSAFQFDPEANKRLLQGPLGYERLLTRDFADAQSVGGVGHTAAAMLDAAIECLLLGFDEPAERLLRFALEWVEIAITTNERPETYFPNGDEAMRYETRSLARWLLFGLHDIEGYERYVEFEDRYLADPIAGRNKTEVSFVLPSYIDAGAFERAIEIFHNTPRLSPPTSLTVRGEGAMAYVVARHRLGLQYSQAEFETIATRFLKTNVNSWLTCGRWDTAARWMKIIHWNAAEPPISAKEALLKCYDYLPRRERPR